MGNLKLQVLWLDDSLGLAINQQTKEGLLPVTSYYFWPISEAWEQIRFELESKPWITENERLELLNLVVEVMNQWQKSRTLINDTAINFKSEIISNKVKIVGIS